MQCKWLGLVHTRANMENATTSWWRTVMERRHMETKAYVVLKCSHRRGVDERACSAERRTNRTAEIHSLMPSLQFHHQHLVQNYTTSKLIIVGRRCTRKYSINQRRQYQSIKDHGLKQTALLHVIIRYINSAALVFLEHAVNQQRLPIKLV